MKKERLKTKQRISALLHLIYQLIAPGVETCIAQVGLLGS
jgi:hypothetical protein